MLVLIEYDEYHELKQLKQLLLLKAGIRTANDVTGDHINTASAIAKQIGILNEIEKVLSGKELTQLSDQELAANIELYSVYAR